MAKKVKYDTEHRDEIYELLAKEVADIEKEINTRFAYKEVGYRTINGHPYAYETKKSDAFAVKVELSVQRVEHIPAGYKKPISWFYLDTVRYVSDLLLYPDEYKKTKDINKFDNAQLRPGASELDKEILLDFEGVYGDMNKYVSERYNKFVQKVEKMILDKYGTKCMCNLRETGKGGATTIYVKGKPEQYKDYYIQTLKDLGADASHFIVEYAKRDYGLVITQEDIDSSPLKPSQELLHKMLRGGAEGDEALIENTKRLEEERKKFEEERAKKEAEDKAVFNKYKELVDNSKKKKRRWKLRLPAITTRGMINSILDDINEEYNITPTKTKRKRVKYKGDNIFKKILSGIATPFIWIWEHIGPGIKKVWEFIYAIFSWLFAGIFYVFKGIYTGISKLFKTVFYGVDKGDVVFTILPLVISITLAILSLTKTVDDLSWTVSTDGTLFGYDFELSGMATSWFEDTDHGFFSALTLGLVQIVLILITFLLDIIVHIIFLVLALLWALVQLIAQIGLLYILPLLIPTYLLIRVIKGDNKGFTIGALIVSILCAVLYFTAPYIV